MSRHDHEAVLPLRERMRAFSRAHRVGSIAAELLRPHVTEMERRAAVPSLTFEEFAREAWRIVEPRPLVWERHMTEMCRHLDAVLRGDILQLIINIPPGTTKSLLTSVLWQPYTWGPFGWPEASFMFASYDADLALRDAKKARRLIESEWFVERWGRLEQPDTWAAGFYINNRGGFRKSGPTGGGFTGHHGDIQVVDDPHKPADIDSNTVSNAALDQDEEWWAETMTTRMRDQATGRRVILMQRLHQGDLSGRAMKKVNEETGKPDYECLCLPMHFDPSRASKTSVGGDWRTQEGELLAPIRWPPSAIARVRRGLGPRAAAAQLEQRPGAPGGTIFQREWLSRFWTAIPRAGVRYVQSWDMAFKKTSGSDMVVGQVWAHRNAAEFWLLDQVRGRMRFVEMLTAVRTLSAKWPTARLKLIEAAANGVAVEDALRKELPGIVLVTPEGGKQARANAVTPLYEAGNVWLPPPERAPWIHDWIEEHADFPAVVHDDQVDAGTQALIRLSLRAPRRLARAMEALRREQAEHEEDERT